MKQLLTVIILSFFTMVCNTSENPFMEESTLPYAAPDFTKIKSEHFEPAILEGIAQQKAEIKEIADNPAAPTFENTLVALEESGVLLGRTMRVFSALSSAHTNEILQNTAEKTAPMLAELSDAMYLNEALFGRIKALYDRVEELNLDAESQKLLQDYYEDFVMAGANLSESEKDKMREYNSRLAELTTRFARVLLAANNAGAVTFTDKNELDGLSEEVLKSLENEEGGWTIPLQNTTQQPLLQAMKNRDARRTLFEASWNRADEGEHDTRPIAEEIAEIRAKRADLLGFDNYAQWSLQRTMAKTPENVFEFFDSLIPAATAKAQAEADEIQQMIRTEGEDFTLEPWDWNYYAEKVRKAKYDLDEEHVKPYFELTTVLEKGVFYAAEKLYGLTFKERKDIPVYHEDVKVYEVFEEDGEPLGLFYGDYFARPNKRGGAWMSNFVSQSKLMNQKPVIYNVANYSKPSAGNPALISFDDVITTFHEFGHALHGFFADQQYPSLSGTSVARDFVEFPSQFNENWALHPDIIKNYALHWQTGEVIPEALIEKIKNAGTFNQGYSLTELLASSNIDMQWHTLAAGEEISDVNAFEKEALHNTKLDVVHAVPPRYRTTYFSHIFSSGYAAGYYSYQWTEMLDYDAYRWFEENGGLTRENGQRFREMILSRGNTEDLEQMYINWRGHTPEAEPMLEARGLK